MGQIFVLCYALSLLLGVLSIGCTARPQPISAPAVTPQPSSLPKWVGERAKVVVMGFENKASLDASAKRTVADTILGASMKQHLIVGLQQTEQFAILNQRGAKRSLTGQDFTPRGEIKRKAFEQIGSLEGAEFLIAGEVKMYQPSLQSLNAGIEADPFFASVWTDDHGVATEPRARAFARLPAMIQDKIAISVRLIDAADGKTVGSTTIEGTPEEFEQRGSGFFDEKLLRASGPLLTPMQKALRACTMKAVNWIAETGLAYRQQVALRPVAPPPALETPIPAKKTLVEKKQQREKRLPESTGKKSGVKVKLVTEQENAEKLIRENPMGEKPIKGKVVGEKPFAEKAIPKNEAPRGEEWGQ